MPYAFSPSVGYTQLTSAEHISACLRGRHHGGRDASCSWFHKLALYRPGNSMDINTEYGNIDTLVSQTSSNIADQKTSSCVYSDGNVACILGSLHGGLHCGFEGSLCSSVSGHVRSCSRRWAFEFLTLAVLIQNRYSSLPGCQHAVFVHCESAEEIHEAIQSWRSDHSKKLHEPSRESHLQNTRAEGKIALFRQNNKNGNLHQYWDDCSGESDHCKWLENSINVVRSS